MVDRRSREFSESSSLASLSESGSFSPRDSAGPLSPQSGAPDGARLRKAGGGGIQMQIQHLQGVAAILGNSLVLLLIWRFKTLRTCTNFLIINLAVADLGISLFGFPFSASSNFAQGWIVGTVGCQWYGFTGMLFGICSIGFLTMISIDRYLLTCRHSVFLRMTFKHYAILAVIAWTNAGFWATAPLLGWCEYSLDPTGTACTVSWTFKSMSYVTYVLSIFVASFLLPGIVIIYCYVRTWQFIIKVGEGGAQENIEWTHEKQVAKMCAVAICLFLIAWTPYAVVCLWAAFGDPDSIPLSMAAAPTVFAKSSACYNPLVYALLCKRFRLAIRKLFGCVKSRRNTEEIFLHRLAG